MKSPILFGLTTAFLVHTALVADNITLTVTGVQSLQNSSSAFLPNGDAVWVGSFDNGFDIAANAGDHATLAANFGYFDNSGAFVGGTQMLTTTITDFGSGLNGSFNASGSVQDAGGNQPPVYVWAFNNSNATIASEHGIFQLSNLSNGVPPLGTTQSLDFASNFVSAPVGSFGGGVGTLTAVPEPSTYTGLIGVALIGFAYWRRMCASRLVVR